MGGKSRKTGSISKKLIDRLKKSGANSKIVKNIEKTNKSEKGKLF